MAYLNEPLKFRRMLSRLAAVLPTLTRGPRRTLLDERGLSDHLRRDMGFVDSLPTAKRR